MKKYWVLLAVILFGCRPVPDAGYTPLPIDSYVKVIIQNEDGDKVGSGSGVIIEKRQIGSHVVTAAHVCDGADQLTVVDRHGHEHPATPVRLEYGVDLCMVYALGLVDSPEIRKTTRHLIPGERVYAISSPFGFDNTTDGMVPIVEGVYMGHYTPEMADRYLATSKRWEVFNLAIGPGSSGGMIVNANGELVSITVRTFILALGYEQFSAGVDTEDLYQFLSQE